MFNRIQDAPDWRTKVKRMKAAAESYEKNKIIMSEYERQLVQAELQARREEWYPSIVRDSLAEYSAKIEKFKSAEKGIQKARQQDAAGWDANKLSAEMNTIQQLADLAVARGSDPMVKDKTVVRRLQEIYDEAQMSGDRYKQRAAGEVMLAMSEKVQGEDRIPAHRLAREAEANLQELRETNEIKNAEITKLAAQRELISFVDELEEVSEFAYGMKADTNLPVGEISFALRRLSQDENGNLVVLDPTDENVSGVVMGPENRMEGGQ